MKTATKLLKYLVLTLALLHVRTVSFTQVALKEIIESDSSLIITDFMSKWIGKPYKYGGTTEKGIDCSGLTQKWYEEAFKEKIPRTAKTQFRTLEKVEKDSLKTGDLVFFRSPQSPSGWHVGIYLWGEKFFHAANRSAGVIVSSLLDGSYQKRIIGFAR